MTLYLIYSETQQTRNATGRNSALVVATDEADARAKAAAQAPDGETKVHAGWRAVAVGDVTLHPAFAGAVPSGVVWFQGEVCEPLCRSRGA